MKNLHLSAFAMLLLIPAKNHRLFSFSYFCVVYFFLLWNTISYILVFWNNSVLLTKKAKPNLDLATSYILFHYLTCIGAGNTVSINILCGQSSVIIFHGSKPSWFSQFDETHPLVFSMICVVFTWYIHILHFDFLYLEPIIFVVYTDLYANEYSNDIINLHLW